MSECGPSLSGNVWPAQFALRGARVIDGAGGTMRDATVVVRDGTVASCVETDVDDDVPTLDVEGRTLMPGLVDVHVHLSSLGLDVPGTGGRSPRGPLHAYGQVAVARRTLECGVTTVRDLGAYGDALRELRAAAGHGLAVAPRLLLCGQIISPPCPATSVFVGMYTEARGADGFRAAVREQVRAGADVVKLSVGGALTCEHEEVDDVFATVEEVRAAVDEAHGLGRRVAAHAEGLDACRLAVGCGVDSVEHGEHLHRAPDVLEEMARRGVALVPTLSCFDYVAETPLYSLRLRERARDLGAAARRTVTAALEAGVRVAMGADVPPHGDNAQELVRLVDAGMPARDALVAATGGAAAVCGAEGAYGVIRPGAAADLLLVDGDPLEQPAVLLDSDRRLLVLQAGRPVGGSLLSVRPFAAPRSAAA